MDKCYVVWSDYDGEIVAISDSLDSAFGIAKLHFISQEVGDIDKIYILYGSNPRSAST
jgi:hypothetical protein